MSRAARDEKHDEGAQNWREKLENSLEELPKKLKVLRSGRKRLEEEESS
jgi:hypothetical protein